MLKDNKEKINFNNLILAIRNTFKNRGSELNTEGIREQIENMKTSGQLIRLWKNYQQTAPYSSNISFDKLFEPLEYITDLLSKEEVTV